MASRKRKKGRPSGGVRQIPSIAFQDFAEADRVFHEQLDQMPVEVKPESPPDEAKTAKRRRAPSEVSLDLHGLSLAEAIDRVDQEFKRLARDLSQPIQLKIITGKGLHSPPGGAVLPSAIHAHVRARYCAITLHLEDSPAETAVAGVPIRGHFTVTIGKKT